MAVMTITPGMIAAALLSPPTTDPVTGSVGHFVALVPKGDVIQFVTVELSDDFKLEMKPATLQEAQDQALDAFASFVFAIK